MLPAQALETLLQHFEVEFVKLAECLVSPGWRLEMAPTDAPGIHYVLSGAGAMAIGEEAPTAVKPHTLAIVPPGRSFTLQVPGSFDAKTRSVHLRSAKLTPGNVRRFVAGDAAPEIILICGYFRASYGVALDPFQDLAAPIFETFAATDRLDTTLKSALVELRAQEAGSGAMSATLLKQVLIAVLRRSLNLKRRWAERFAGLQDPQIARAFTSMLARPGAAHSVATLSQASGLSRSAFMVRFKDAFGESPMAVLRAVRLKRARAMLATGRLNTIQVAHAVGYSSRTAFHRAYAKAFGEDAAREA
jgi:AraC family transcriptional regulator, activator of mtrCDE